MNLRRGYQPRPNIVNDEKGEMLANSNIVLSRLKSHAYQLLSVYAVNPIRQTEIHTSEPVVSKLCAFEAEMVSEELKKSKSPDTDQIPAELIHTGSRTVHRQTNALI